MIKRTYLTLLAVAAAIAGYAIASPAQGATQVVSDFGDNGWYSWDTRSDTGAQLVGTHDTSPAWNGTHTSADDTAINKQIIFMGEGQVVNDSAGGTPPASPSGSLNGLGYVRLDGTDTNSGKSDISYVNTSGIAAPSALTDSGFFVNYRYYIQPNPTFRTLGLNISITNANQSALYTFAFVDPNAVAGWNTSSADNSTSLFTLFANGSSAESGAAKTLAQWQADPTFGSQVFATGNEIFRVGFNVGSGQRNSLEYLDWTQSSLLNNGDVVDFKAAPEPGTATLGLLGIAGLAASWKLRRKRTA